MPPDDDELELHGQQLINEDLSYAFSVHSDAPSKVSLRSIDRLRPLPQLKVGILGAGVTGLYTALILDSLGIEYDILEASGRIGGRIQTVRFAGGGAYDYYEAGAMRFPLPKKDTNGQYKNGFMKRVGKLIEYGPLNTGKDNLKDKLIPYHYTVKGPRSAFQLIKGVITDLPPTNDGVLRPTETKPKPTVDPKDPYTVMDGLVEHFLDEAKKSKDFYQFDPYSVRTYFASHINKIDAFKSLSTADVRRLIEKCELVVTGTRAFDMSISEWVIGSVAFGQVRNRDPVEWKCFKDGTETLTKKMAEYIYGKRPYAIQTCKRVTAISEDTMVVCLCSRQIPSDWKTTDSKLVDAVIHEGGMVTYFVPPRIYSTPPPPPPQPTQRPPQSYSSWNTQRPPPQPTQRPPQSHSPRNTQRPPPQPTQQSPQSYSPWNTQRPPPQPTQQPPQSHPTSWMRVKVPCVTVTVNGTEIRKYSHVMSTLSLPVLRGLDLTKAGLSDTQVDAIRALNYWPSIKIAILFRTNWWTRILGIVGGQSFTDLPIRTIVYPSYGDHSTTSGLHLACKVLIASYTWTNDARALRALAPREKHAELIELVLRNLAEAHSRYAAKHKIQDPNINADVNVTYKYLKGQFVAMDVKDWSADEYTRGGFAHWYPGNYENFHSALAVPAVNNRRLHFAGEAISMAHGWVSGSFESTWSAVNNYLQLTGQSDKLDKFRKEWGADIKWTK